MDVAPLRESRGFRLLWAGDVVSNTGWQVTTVALYVQVYELTRSAASVGLVGLVQLLPMALVSVLIGPVIDRRDRRGVLLAAIVGQAAASALLVGGAMLGRTPVGLVFVGAALHGGLIAVTLPTRASMVPNLLPARLLPATAALNMTMWNTAAIIGPALGGVLVARFGLGWAYGFDVATYGVALACVARIRPMLPTGAAEGEEPRGLRAVREGFAYLRGRRVLQSTFTLDLVAMVFGMPRALFPVLAVEQFGRGPETVGVLFSALAAGALAGALTSGWVGAVRRQGLAILVAVAVWGAAIVGFGAAGSALLPALVFLAVAGAADVVSGVFRTAIQQHSVPDSLRGRIGALNGLVVAGGPGLGDLEAGVVASLTTPTFSVVLGGALCLAGVAAVSVAVPRVARWRLGDPA